MCKNNTYYEGLYPGHTFTVQMWEYWSCHHQSSQIYICFLYYEYIILYYHIFLPVIIFLLRFHISPFQLMEEYDWGEFAVITSLLPGYDTFVDIVQSYTDTSYFLWNLQDILSLEMSVGANDARTKRMLQQVQWAIRILHGLAQAILKSTCLCVKFWNS